MKKLIAFILILMLAFSAYAEAEVYYAAENRSWYHAEKGCDFGGLALRGGETGPESRELTKAEAEALYLRPCPACAREWKAVFSGDFPEWTHAIAPWGIGQGGGPETYLPYELRKEWGDFSNAMHEKYGDGPFPDGYASLYMNASGGVTMMLTEPTMERVEIIRRYMGAEFWTLEADFDWNYLTRLQDALVDMMGDEFGIHSIGTCVDGNCLSVGVDQDTPEIAEAICKIIEEKGFDRRAVVIMQEGRAEWL